MAAPELIVMLTLNDRTVKNASQVFEQCKHSKAKYFGFKEEGIPLSQMIKLYNSIKACGKSTVLEVVAYSEYDGLAGAKIAAECGCDILMGTMYHDSIRDFCKEKGIKYMPYVGDVLERPSVLTGSIDGMIAEAKECLEKGVDGFDLLGYRYTEDARELIERFVNEVDAPVCVAGSVDSYERLDELKDIEPWSFTIGGAFFNNRFDGTIPEQIDKVCEYIEE
ncbi:MAG: hypothetical protein IJS27_04885 [Ruminococcus sp.]|nr:hypothetical protein [Ruminococcus sp.]MBQ9514474.1 hypothetical protein [Ruminococcus sp.]